MAKKESEIEALQNQLVALENQLAEKDGATNDDGTASSHELGEDGIKEPAKIVTPRPARDVYTTIVDEVKNASEQLESTAYTLSNISLNLKTHVLTDEEGFKLQLIDAETAANTNQQAVSEVKIDIGTKSNSNNQPETNSTPNVMGLTETAARLRLKSYGLGMKTIYQVSTTKTIGQAFKQNPAAGNDINKGENVVVIFAKNSEKFN